MGPAPVESYATYHGKLKGESVRLVHPGAQIEFVEPGGVGNGAYEYVHYVFPVCRQQENKFYRCRQSAISTHEFPGLEVESWFRHKSKR